MDIAETIRDIFGAPEMLVGIVEVSFPDLDGDSGDDPDGQEE